MELSSWSEGSPHPSGPRGSQRSFLIIHTLCLTSCFAHSLALCLGAQGREGALEAHFPAGFIHLPTFLMVLELLVTLTDGSAVGLHSPAINFLVFFCNVSQLPHPWLSGLKREGHYPLARHIPLCCFLYPSTSEPRSSLHGYLMLHWVGTTLGSTAVLEPGLDFWE